MDTNNQLHMMVYAALLAALTAVGAYVVIPIGPVPIVLQSLFIYLMGLILGTRWGVAGVAVYLLAGALGLPVFAGGTGGIGRIVGPTGGYLLGFLPAVFVCGLISNQGKANAVKDIIAMLCATLIIYTCGVWWLKTLTAMDLKKALAVGMFPFLIGDAIKMAVAVAVARNLRPMIAARIKATAKKHSAP